MTMQINLTTEERLLLQTIYHTQRNGHPVPAHVAAQATHLIERGLVHRTDHADRTVDLVVPDEILRALFMAGNPLR